MKQTLTITTKFTKDPKNPYEELSFEFDDKEALNKFMVSYKKIREEYPKKVNEMTVPEATIIKEAAKFNGKYIEHDPTTKISLQ